MATPIITREEVMARFSVETVHDGALEFVLDDARSRTGRDYEELLIQRLRDADIEVTSVQMYYWLSFTISAPTISELEIAGMRAKRVVKSWLNRYNVNRMRRNK